MDSRGARVVSLHGLEAYSSRMADEQAIASLKKGAYLLKYGRRGKPKFCPFRLSSDESTLFWHSGKDEKQLKLSQVSKIIPGQRTAIFQRYPRPEKEYQSFSLIYNDRSLDLMCKDKDEAEVWFVGLNALILQNSFQRLRTEPKSDRIAGYHCRTYSNLSSLHCGSDIVHKEFGDTGPCHISYQNPLSSGLGKAFANVMLCTASTKSSGLSDSVDYSSKSFLTGGDGYNAEGCTVDTFRSSLSSAVSSSSWGSSCQDDFNVLGDIYIWGEGAASGLLGDCVNRVSVSYSEKADALLPKVLESEVILNARMLDCGSKHAALVTRQGEVFCWGQGTGGWLGHGVVSDVSHPKLVDALSGMNVELVACGEYHTFATTSSGDIYTWGSGSHYLGLLGLGNDVSHWLPSKVIGCMEGVRVLAVSCGTWHTAILACTGQLFTFGDGTFGVLGHGDRKSSGVPKEVESLRGLRTIQACCGVWHTAALVEIMVESSSNILSGKLFTWGDGDKGRLGHGDSEPRLVPECVASLVDENFSQVACGHDMTLALTTPGRVYTMGSTLYCLRGSTQANGKGPTLVDGKIHNSSVEAIACGSYHVAVLTSSTEVYTWGKGSNGQLGHGDLDDRDSPTLVEALREKHVKSVVCGSNFTAAICLHKWLSTSDQSICSGCHCLFGFRRKRHNCYNCGLVFCTTCTGKKSLKASLAPNANKPHRVCDACYNKLKAKGASLTSRSLKPQNGSYVSEGVERESLDNASWDSLDNKLRWHPLKLSFIDTLKKTGHFKYGKKVESINNHTSGSIDGSYPEPSIYSSRSSSVLLRPSKRIFCVSVHGSSSMFQDSPYVKRSLSHSHSIFQSSSPILVVNDSRKTEEKLTQEVIKLRSQVVNLAHKSKVLQAELERTSRQLNEVTVIASEETAKCLAAKEVIKSLTIQLKDIAERMVPERSAIGRKSSSIASHALNILNLTSSDNHLNYPAGSHDHETCAHLSNIMNSEEMNSPTEVEWVEQDEPGVHITLSSLSSGVRKIRRVRFSRKHFNEQKAEKWWPDNKARLYEKYNVEGIEASFGSLSTSEDKAGAVS